MNRNPLRRYLQRHQVAFLDTQSLTGTVLVMAQCKSSLHPICALPACNSRVAMLKSYATDWISCWVARETEDPCSMKAGRADAHDGRHIVRRRDGSVL
jgi:hypothetical protein